MKEIQAKVMTALLKDEQARDDDCILYATVCSAINPLTTSLDMGTVLRHHEEFGLPSFESISRCRRRIQKEHPELRASKNATNRRYKQWRIVREWAIEE